MGFMKDTALVAAGYGLSELVNERKNKHELHNDESLEDVIDKWAHTHNIWGRDTRFYKQLLAIADKYYDPYDI